MVEARRHVRRAAREAALRLGALVGLGQAGQRLANRRPSDAASATEPTSRDVGGSGEHRAAVGDRGLLLELDPLPPALKTFLRKRKGWVTCTPKQIPMHMCFILLPCKCCAHAPAPKS